MSRWSQFPPKISLSAGCDIAVTHQDDMGTMDPVFNPIINSDSEDFRKTAAEQMAQEEKQQSLQAAYKQLADVVGYANSPQCKGKDKCSLTGADNKFSLVKGKEPSVEGPLKTAA